MSTQRLRAVAFLSVFGAPAVTGLLAWGELLPAYLAGGLGFLGMVGAVLVALRLAPIARRDGPGAHRAQPHGPNRRPRGLGQTGTDLP